MRRSRLLILAGALSLLAGCAEITFLTHAAKEVSKPGQSGPSQSDAPGGNGGRYKIGNPYQIKGEWYYPKVDYDYVEEGIASWYGPKFHGRKTANGAIFDMNKVSAAHRTLPMPSMVRVTNLENGRSIRVKVNDRGPFAHRRIIDMSRRAAQLLGFERQGTALVRVEILPDESRRLAYLMKNGIAPEEVAPAPKAAPAQVVLDEELPPPSGAESSQTDEAYQVDKRVQPTEEQISRQPLEAPKLDETVSVVPVPPATSIFVQAGAFAQHANAVRAQARLQSVGPTVIEQYNKSQTPLFRVRVGPVQSAADADMALAKVIANGFPDAHIVVLD